MFVTPTDDMEKEWEREVGAETEVSKPAVSKPAFIDSDDKFRAEQERQWLLESKKNAELEKEYDPRMK